MKIVIATVTGNWFDAAAFINRWDLADNVVSIGPMVGLYTQVALRIREDMIGYYKEVGVI